MVLACLACANMHGESVKPATAALTNRSIMIDKQDISRIRMSDLPESEQKLIAKMPANVHFLGAVKQGETADAQPLTVRFAAETKLTGIRSTPDFKLEQGGSCVEGNVYPAKSSCTLLVRFTPQGAGHRLGKITLSHSGAAEPLVAGITGYAYFPVASFNPALYTTVAVTLPGGKGLLKGAQSLAVDGGDGLYIADTGNNLIRYIDSSGAISTIAGGGTFAISGDDIGLATAFALNAPYGVAADAFGNVYIGDTGDREVLDAQLGGVLFTVAGGGTGASCNPSSPCAPLTESLGSPNGVTIDSSGNLFFENGVYPMELYDTLDKLTYVNSPIDLLDVEGGPALLVDRNDNLYTADTRPAEEGYPGQCNIIGQNRNFNLATGGITLNDIWIVAGSRKCGYSGDEGQAANAEIGALIPQMAFDLAGNLYFSDSSNHRVRRIDVLTGIIHTLALFSNPTGVAVDSQGQVYVISSTSGTAQDVAKLGPYGSLAFATQPKGTSSAAHLIEFANTGNDSLLVTSVSFAGTGSADFSIDPKTTSCNFAAGNFLYSGQSCQIGIIFKPTAVGNRSARLIILDNSVNKSNSVLLFASATAGAAASASPVSMKITSPQGSAISGQNVVKFGVAVSSVKGPAPTGTVSFRVDGAAFGAPVPVASGGASVNLTGLKPGSHGIAASYSGDANYTRNQVSRTIAVMTGPVTRLPVRLPLKFGPPILADPPGRPSSKVVAPVASPVPSKTDDRK
jgi:hypothetical protein